MPFTVELEVVLIRYNSEQTTTSKLVSDVMNQSAKQLPLESSKQQLAPH